MLYYFKGPEDVSKPGGMRGQINVAECIVEDLDEKGNPRPVGMPFNSQFAVDKSQLMIRIRHKDPRGSAVKDHNAIILRCGALWGWCRRAVEVVWVWMQPGLQAWHARGGGALPCIQHACSQRTAWIPSAAGVGAAGGGGQVWGVDAEGSCISTLQLPAFWCTHHWHGRQPRAALSAPASHHITSHPTAGAPRTHQRGACASVCVHGRRGH